LEIFLFKKRDLKMNSIIHKFMIGTQIFLINNSIQKDLAFLPKKENLPKDPLRLVAYFKDCIPKKLRSDDQPLKMLLLGLLGANMIIIGALKFA
jgi:hypothetical protein